MFTSPQGGWFSPMAPWGETEIRGLFGCLCGQRRRCLLGLTVSFLMRRKGVINITFYILILPPSVGFLVVFTLENLSLPAFEELPICFVLEWGGWSFSLV